MSECFQFQLERYVKIVNDYDNFIRRWPCAFRTESKTRNGLSFYGWSNIAIKIKVVFFQPNFFYKNTVTHIILFYLFIVSSMDYKSLIDKNKKNLKSMINDSSVLCSMY